MKASRDSIDKRQANRLRDDKPGQWLLPRIARAEAMLRDEGRVTGRHWVPGNEMADTLAKEAAHDGNRPLPREDSRVVTLAHVSSRTTESRSAQKAAWPAKRCKPKGYFRHRGSLTSDARRP